MKGRRLVSEIRLGPTRLFPYDCETRPLPELCTDDATEIRDKGCELFVVDESHDAGTHRYLFSAECHGNTMCASFGFWTLTTGPDGATAHSVTEGCFPAPPRL